MAGTHLAIYHVRNHHDLVSVGVRELEGQLGGLNIIGQDNAVWPDKEVMAACDDGEGCVAALNGIPQTHKHLAVDGDANMVRDVIFPSREKAC